MMNRAHTLLKCSSTARQLLSSHYAWLPGTFHGVEVVCMLHIIPVKFFSSFWMQVGEKKIKKLTPCFQSLPPFILPVWAYLSPALRYICLNHRCCNSQKAQLLFKEMNQVVWKVVVLLCLESCLFTGLAQLPMDNNNGKSNGFAL